MTKTCLGCGIPLQTEDPNQVGYVDDLEKEYCERCFKIRHYNHYQTVEKSNQDYLSILKEISLTKDLVVFVVDLLNISPMITEILSLLKQNPVLLVLTKRDLLPKSLYESRLLDYMDQYGTFIDKILISSKKNYQFDQLLEKIVQYQVSDRVYVVGLTNAGKSTMLNQMIKNYTTLDYEITTSMQSSTTLGMISVPIRDTLTLVDTPGILDEGNLLNVVPSKMMKKIIPKKEIRPISYQVKGTQYFWIEDFCALHVTDNTIIFYLSNALSIKRFYHPKDTTSLYRYTFELTGKEDIVIPGLGFIKIEKKGKVDIFLPEQTTCFVRKNFI